VAEIGLDAVHVHDEHAADPSAAFALSRLSSSPQGPTPLGVFRDVTRPLYEDELQRQLRRRPGAAAGPSSLGRADPPDRDLDRGLDGLGRSRDGGYHAGTAVIRSQPR